ncbi:hypothetical protein PDIDSM_2102 [Penicillium digitatum]|nr:hypothetical protein PDIDSM_2102 [Penicillium digitatum]
MAPPTRRPVISLLLAVEALWQYVGTSTNLTRITSLDHAGLIDFRARFVEGDPRVVRAMREGLGTSRQIELLTAHSSRGREASAYLSFIVDLYDELPEYSIFLHANTNQWHNDLFGPQTSRALQSLRREAVDAKGYLNLRCASNPGCPFHVNPNNPTQAHIDKNDARANFPRICKEIFGEDAYVPEQIGGICCAQFAVSRTHIRQRPKSDYVRMLNWMNEKSVPLVETLWHMVFGMERVQ